ncbi:hypothetical protein BDW74DRAFT_152514 [Aspergillus multicolor]|uniref:uncharacterized protein n=1 Tax=Aspergillus multicolor TaxID=41759 RepID=UPI003CCDAB74
MDRDQSLPCVQSRSLSKSILFSFAILKLLESSISDPLLVCSVYISANPSSLPLLPPFPPTLVARILCPFYCVFIALYRVYCIRDVLG